MTARFLVLVALTTLAARPADACTGCKPPTTAELVAAAPRVFAGKVVAAGKSTITLDVAAIWKGDVPEQLVFATTCWFALKPGATVIILDRAGKPSKWISECLEVMRDTAATRAQLTALAGAPHAP